MKNLGLPGLHLLRASQKGGKYTSILAQHKDRLSILQELPHAFSPSQNVNAIEVQHVGVNGLLTAIIQDKNGANGRAQEIEDSFLSRGFEKKPVPEIDGGSNATQQQRSFLRKPVRVFYLSRDWGNNEVDGLLLAGSANKGLAASAASTASAVPTSVASSSQVKGAKGLGAIEVEAILFNQDRLFLKEKMELEAREEVIKNRIKTLGSLIEYKEFVRCSSGFARSVLMCAWCLGGASGGIVRTENDASFNIPKGAEREYFEMHYNNAKVFASRLVERSNFISSQQQQQQSIFPAFVPYQLKKLESHDPIVIRGTRTLDEDPTLYSRPTRSNSSRTSPSSSSTSSSSSSTSSARPTSTNYPVMSSGSISQEILAFIAHRETKGKPNASASKTTPTTSSSSTVSNDEDEIGSPQPPSSPM